MSTIDISTQQIKTHTETSAEDSAAVSTLQSFLRSDGKINTNFAFNDKWPNTDGTFEFVPDPDISRRPKQNFFVQIKGTGSFSETDDGIRYSLKSLAFPAFIANNVTLDPGILFVVTNPGQRGAERVFWKYMSANYVNSINYDHNSVTVHFSHNEEIKNTDESVDEFCHQLEKIVEQHSFVSGLESREYNRCEIERIINACNEQITECIDRMEILNETRDGVSKRILTRLSDLCSATLILNSIHLNDTNSSNLQLAWEQSLLSINTKYLGTFLKGLRYIGGRIPDEGQSERLMLKYYDFLWQIRKFLHDEFSITVLSNLEKFPRHTDKLDEQYYELVAETIESAILSPCSLGSSRFYVQKTVPFFVGTERYYEVTLQLAGIYATKYNRITVYSKSDISTNYSVQIGYTEATINLWDVSSSIKIITNWKVSIEPKCLNTLAKILCVSTKITSRYGEYSALMDFLTTTGIDILTLIDITEVKFNSLIDNIYRDVKTKSFKSVLEKLKAEFSDNSEKYGRNVVRYLLHNLREETLENVLPTQFNRRTLSDDLYISSRCMPFEKNPFVADLAGKRTSEIGQISHVISAAGSKKLDLARPYIMLKNKTKQTGEIYFDSASIASVKEIEAYNSNLDVWECNQGYQINQENGLACINFYEKTTIRIIQKLQELSREGNGGQKELNQHFLDNCGIEFADNLKRIALQNVFVYSRVLLIYGAAGTGKTTLINYISNLMSGRRKLFLTKTHTALQNLRRRIENPGQSSDFISIDSFTKKVSLDTYDVIFVDECSTIDNRTMYAFINKIKPGTLFVFAGDIHQIESIDFGNWFFYAKELIKARGANVELLNTWRTHEQDLIDLWAGVRARETIITEKLVIDGPFSEDIGPKLFQRSFDDEVVLCLNYDGKFGLNNINNYFQNANTNSEAISWNEWTYKIGDPILFNDTKRFPILYNNLKGKIVGISKTDNSISFAIDTDIILTELDCQNSDIEFIGVDNNQTRIGLTVYSYDVNKVDEDDEELRMKSVVPFQLAYAVSIHKAQGLEYDSVKIVIPTNNAEKISHGIFYTAITRAKKKVKIYWSSETMQDIVNGFTSVDSTQKSFEIIKEKLAIPE